MLKTDLLMPCFPDQSGKFLLLIFASGVFSEDLRKVTGLNKRILHNYLEAFRKG